MTINEKKEVALIEKHCFGVVPEDYPTSIMRGCKVHDSDVWITVQNTMGNIRRKKELMQDYYTSHNYQRNIAEELGLLSDLDRCVESAFDIQLKTLNPEGNMGGINTECSHWKHRARVFTSYLKSQYFKDEVLQYSKDCLMLIIPDELEEKLK